jgi:hypothetical protein
MGGILTASGGLENHSFLKNQWVKRESAKKTGDGY